MAATKDNYTVLGITPNASENEVRQAYRDRLKIWHPDRFAHENERLKQLAEEHTKQLNEAYAAVCDSFNRSSESRAQRASRSPRSDFQQSSGQKTEPAQPADKPQPDPYWRRSSG